MQSLFISFRSELYKFKRSTIFFSSILFPLILMILIFYGWAHGIGKTELPKFPVQRIGMMQWTQLIGNLGNILSALLVPFYTMFLAYSDNDLEHKADMWKSMFSLPLPKASVYLGKYLYAIFLLLLLFLTFFICALLGTRLLQALYPQHFYFSEYEGTGLLLKYLFKFFLSSLGILAIQMTMSQLWKDFFKPVGIGFLGIIMGNLWAFKDPDTAYLFPYSQTIRAAFIQRSKVSSGVNPLADFQLFTNEIGMSLVYLVVLGILGYIILLKRNIK